MTRMTEVCNTKYRNELTHATAHIRVWKSEDGKFQVDTWLPAGMCLHRQYPEWRDRTDTIDAARAAWKKRNNYLLKHFARS